MSQNISKYCQLTDFILLEYEFNRDGTTTDLTSAPPCLAVTELGAKQYFNTSGVGITNNTLSLQSVPEDAKRSTWYVNPSYPETYYDYFDSSTLISQTSYAHDTIKVHVVSGYNFDDIAGFLLQVRAEDTSSNLVDMSNFTWIKQVSGNSVVKFAIEPLYLGNRFYDKYIEFKVPSIGTLGGQTLENIEAALLIKLLSDVYIQYSTITSVVDYEYLISEKIQTQLPVTSNADNFNCYIAESTAGDYIEYYATWKDYIIGEYMSDIESGRIALFTSNNPNDNYQAFVDEYGTQTSKWVVIHEIQVYEHVPPSSTLMTQRFQFTQDNNFMLPNKFRPVIVNSDIASSYSIDYICRLTNRMDGSQIIRKASFASMDPRKYGKTFSRINVDNYVPYKVFNKLPSEKANIVLGSSQQRTKFTKVFYDTTNVVLNMDNEVLPQGTGPLFLKNGDSTYKLKFERLNTDEDVATPNRENVDLSGVYNYSLLFVLDSNKKIEAFPTYSSNMNTVLGELEFKLSQEQVTQLLGQTGNTFSIVIKNPDGTQYTFYEGSYYPYSNVTQVVSQYKNLFDINSLNNKIAGLESQVKTLEEENATLRTNT